MTEEEQATQIQTFMRHADARTKEDEDEILLLFIGDPNYKVAALMDGVGRWRSELRNQSK